MNVDSPVAFWMLVVYGSWLTIAVVRDIYLGHPDEPSTAQPREPISGQE